MKAGGASAGHSRALWRCIVLLWLMMSASSSFAVPPHPDSAWNEMLSAGIAGRTLGNLDDSIAALQRAEQLAPDPQARALARLQLGISLAQTGRLAQATATLERAYREVSPERRYVVALALGHLAVRSHDPVEAARYYEDAIASAQDDLGGAEARVVARLYLAALQPPLERLTALKALAPDIDSMQNGYARARSHFALGQYASEAVGIAKLSHSPQLTQAVELSERGFNAALSWADEHGELALSADTDDALAQLREDQDQYPDAEALNERAIALSHRLKLGQAELRLVRLEWRSARLAQRRNDMEFALAAYMRSANHLEAIRGDLPIDDSRGHSNYETLQRPLLVGLADLLLRGVDALPPEQQQLRLRNTIQFLEQVHQAELQDYLGDRCSVESARQTDPGSVAAGLAVVYPLVLRDRLEIIVATAQGLYHHSTPVVTSTVTREILRFRAALIDTTSDDYRLSARRIHEWLLASFGDVLSKAGIHSLIFVPDGYLRLIPFGALRDEYGFLAQRYVISTVTGLTMTDAQTVTRHKAARSLFVGLSSPGPVVDRLEAMGFKPDSDLTSTRGLRGSGHADSAADTEDLRAQLTLPAVLTEIQDLAPLSRSASLLNEQFTVDRFAHELKSGDYRVVHIASHGFFGDNAGASFLLAYDNVIRIDQLQQLIAIGDSPEGGIDLLTLSACDTATGNSRAPLGFAGAAIKARARSVLGSLWAVNDAATQQFMDVLYRQLPEQGKALAFAAAQRRMIESQDFSHPYYWAAFVLTGDWR
jgi:CHAT domain-containing protein